MPSPFRAAIAQEILEAPTRDGVVKLTRAPHHVQLELGARTVTVTRDFFSVTHKKRRRRRRRSFGLEDTPVYVAKAWPTNEVSLWVEQKRGIAWRAAGLRPIPSLEEGAIRQWHKLDRLGAALGEALRDHAAGAVSAGELGRGQHRVLTVRYADRLAVYARPVFREQPRKVVELCADGSVLFTKGRRHRTAQVENCFGVILSGDRIRFCSREGDDQGSVFLPWISAADRAELTRRFRALLPGEEEHAAAKPEFPLNRPLDAPAPG